MKKIIFTTLLVLLSQTAQARSFDEIRSSGVIKVGVPADYAPLAYFNENERLVGFDVDMAKDLAKDLGVVPQFVITSWPTLSSDLQNDLYDVAMGGVTYTQGRAAQFLLSDAIVPNGKIALAACAVADKLSDLDNINQPNVRLVVNPGGTNESFVNANIVGAQVIRVKDNFDNLQALRDETADVMITDLIEGNYYQYKEPNVLCLATTTPFAGTESYKSYMVQKDNEALITYINQWLTTVDKVSFAQKWGIQLNQ